MATSIWKGHITFGLVSIPVRLFAAARGERMSFNQLHKECHSRIRQPLFCPTCNRQVERSEIVKGYEYEKEQYVLVDDKELEKIAPPSASTMEILEFVRVADVDPVFFDASYYVVPEEAGRKAYYLLVCTMEESGHAAVARLTMHQREFTVVIRPRRNGLTLHTIFYPNEVRAVAEYGQETKMDVTQQELQLAEKLVESLAAEFQPEKYKDQYQDRLKTLIDAKLAGREVAEVAKPQLAPVIDLMDALKKSLAQREAVPRKPLAPALAEAEQKKGRKKSAS